MLRDIPEDGPRSVSNAAVFLKSVGLVKFIQFNRQLYVIATEPVWSASF
jgi:hypothetical protein